MRNFALFSAATWRIRHAGRQTWAEVNKKKWLFGPGGLKHWVTHGPVAGVNALSIQAKTNPNQAKQNPKKKKIANKKKSHNIKFQSGFHGKLLYSLDFFLRAEITEFFRCYPTHVPTPCTTPFLQFIMGNTFRFNLSKTFRFFPLYMYIYFCFFKFFLSACLFYNHLFLFDFISSSAYFCGRSLCGIAKNQIKQR